jgi:hypothetical protein
MASAEQAYSRKRAMKLLWRYVRDGATPALLWAGPIDASGNTEVAEEQMPVPIRPHLDQFTDSGHL